MKKILYILLINFLFFKNLEALIEVDITRGNLDPLPIAISPLHVDIKSENFKDLKVQDLGAEIAKIIEKNFRSTGLFNPLKKRGLRAETRYCSSQTKIRRLAFN